MSTIRWWENVKVINDWNPLNRHIHALDVASDFIISIKSDAVYNMGLTEISFA